MTDFVLPPPPPPPAKAAAPNRSATSQNHNNRGRGVHRGRNRGSNFRGSSRGRAGFHQDGHPRRPQVGAAASQDRPVQNNSYNLGSVAHAPRPGPAPNSAISRLPESINGSNDPFRKRKWNDDKSNNGENPVKVKPIKKPKVEAAPAVPSFAFALPVPIAPITAAATSSQSNLSSKSRPKPKSNPLGLTPQGEIFEESEEGSEDEIDDEEAAYAARVGQTTNLRIEYNGRVYELNTNEGKKSWVEERRKNWPTKARVDERKKQQQEREALKQQREREALKQKQELLRKRLQEEKARKSSSGDKNAHKALSKPSTKKDKRSKNPESLEMDIQKHLAKAEKYSAKADKIRAKLEQMKSKERSEDIQEADATPNANSEKSRFALEGAEHEEAERHKESDAPALRGSSPIAKPPEQEAPTDETMDKQIFVADESLGSDSPSHSTDGSSSNASSSDSDSDSSSDISQTDGPEEQSSKAEVPLPVIPPTNERPQRSDKPPNPQVRSKTGDQRHVGDRRRTFQGGRETIKQKQPDASKKKSLYQRMVEQELEAENRLVLQAIKYLGHSGLLSQSD